MRAKAVALTALLTVGVAALLAHEGHAPLPTRGVQVDVARGHLLLTADARDGLGVTTAEVESRAVEARVLAYATVVVPWTGHGFATSRLAGRVAKVRVVPGQVVRAGDIVAEVRSLDLETLQLDVLTAGTEIALAEKLVGGLTATADAGAGSGQAVADAELALAQARNRLAVAESKWLALGLTQADFDALARRRTATPGLTLPVRVPVGGTVVHAELTVGQVVEPADHLAEVTDLSTVWVRVGVLEKDLRRVAVGTPVEFRFSAAPDEVVRATVAAAAPFLDPVTHLASVWAELPNPPGREPLFVPGMAGRADLILAADRPRPTVPAEAVVREGAERFVLVEEANAAGAAEFRRASVAPGRRAGGRVELLAGSVFPGDRVVVQGAHELGGFFAPAVLRLDAVGERGVGLRVEPAEVAAVDEVVTLDGAVDLPPGSRGSVSSSLAGTVTAIRVDRGQAVEAGDVLAEVSSPEFLTLQLDLVRVALDYRLEADTLARIKGLGAVARRRVWEAESRVTSLGAQVETLRRKLATAGLSPAQVEAVIATKRVAASVPVRAPIAGVVVAFDKALGQAVTARESLFEVHDPAKAAVVGYVSERDAGRVRVGQAVRVRLVADPGVVLTGRVARSGRTVGPGSRSHDVYVDLDAPPARPLVHGQLATLTVVTATRPPAVTVPLAAVAGEGAAAFVFVRRATDGVFDRRAVETGPADDRRVTVIRGLAAGEPVAVAGVAELTTGFASLK